MKFKGGGKNDTHTKTTKPEQKLLSISAIQEILAKA